MMAIFRYALAILLVSTAALAPISQGTPRADSLLDTETRSSMSRLFLPIPPARGLDYRKVELGERLFRDSILSRDRTIACANCHDVAAGGDDGKRVSMGIDRSSTKRNALSVYNVGLQQFFFWDGRARSLEEQIDGPILSPVEMASDWAVIVARLSQDPAYRQSFGALYGGWITVATIKDAIVQYEKSLNTPGSAFDKFLAGDTNALTLDEQQGLTLFVQFGCAACHQGMLLGGDLFQRAGVYQSRNEDIESSDLGRFNVTGRQYDKLVFKVPSLRNVALTAPYFHDGSAPDLESAIRTMARIQLNRYLETSETEYLAAFLRTLTALPADRPQTQEAKR